MHRYGDLKRTEKRAKKVEWAEITQTAQRSTVQQWLENTNGKKKQLYEYFKWEKSKVSHEKILTRLRRGNLNRVTETQNTTKPKEKKNNVKGKIDKTQHNSKSRFCGGRDETINLIINKLCKLAQKDYKTQHDFVEKVNH